MAATFRIGIDLGGTKIEAIAIDRAGRIRARRRIATPTGDYHGTIAAVAGLVAAIESGIGARASIGPTPVGPASAAAPRPKTDRAQQPGLGKGSMSSSLARIAYSP